MSDERVIKSYICGEAITQYAAVAIDSNTGNIVISDDPDSTTEMFIGIAQEAGAADDVIDVVIHGESFAIAGTGGLTGNTSSLMAESGGTGELIPFAATGVAGTPNYVVGRALLTSAQPGATDGDKFRVFVNSLYFPTA